MSRPKKPNHRSLREDLDLVDLNQMFMKPVVSIRVLSRRKEGVATDIPLKELTLKIDEHPHRPGITFLGALAHSGKLQGFHGLLVVIFHRGSPFVYLIDEKLQGEYEKKRELLQLAGFDDKRKMDHRWDFRSAAKRLT